jgi:hypothetical protein
MSSADGSEYFVLSRLSAAFVLVLSTFVSFLVSPFEPCGYLVASYVAILIARHAPLPICSVDFWRMRPFIVVSIFSIGESACDLY